MPKGGKKKLNRDGRKQQRADQKQKSAKAKADAKEDSDESDWEESRRTEDADLFAAHSASRAAMMNLQVPRYLTLPFIADLVDPPRETIVELIASMEANDEVNMMKNRLKLRVAKDEKRGYAAGTESIKTSRVRHKLKVLEGREKVADDKARKAVDAHFRKVSRVLHPDRLSDGTDPIEARARFEKLGRARKCLRDFELRKMYISQMIQMQEYNEDMLQQSHDTWVARYMPDTVTGAEATNATNASNEAAAAEKQERQRRKKKAAAAAAAAAQNAPLMIAQGGMGIKPRKALVFVKNSKSKLIRVQVQLRYGFASNCESIIIVAKSPNYEPKYKDRYFTVGGFNQPQIESAMERMEKDGADIVELTLHEASLPTHGIWSIQWFANFAPEFDADGNRVLRQSQTSHETEIELSSGVQEALVARLAATDALAKQRAGRIHQVLHQVRGPHIPIVARCEMLHSAIARGRSTLRQLQALCGDQGSASLDALHEALAQAVPVKTNLETNLAVHTKKEDLKAFKRYVASLLEQGNAADWVKNLDEDDDLAEQGGDSNRLYQILVEGKTAKNHLELDAETLSAAAMRDDLFTEKQCEVLLRKAEEARQDAEREATDALAAAEEERAREEAEAAERKATQAKGLKPPPPPQKSIPVSATIVISGLTSAAGQKLNGQTGVVKKKTGARYVVIVDGRELSLPATGISVKPSPDDEKSIDTQRTAGTTATSSSGPVDEPWSCNICTYRHEGREAVMLICLMCQEKRIAKPAHVISTPKPASIKPPPAAKAAPPKQPPKQTKRTTKNPPINTTSPTKTPVKKAPVKKEPTKTPQKPMEDISPLMNRIQLQQAKVKSPAPPQTVPAIASTPTPIQRPSQPVVAVSPDTAVASISDPLLSFLQGQASCIKGSVDAFHQWLLSEDIDSLEALGDAVSDDEYVRNEMQRGGGGASLKGFKRAAFKKAALAAAESDVASSVVSQRNSVAPRDSMSVGSSMSQITSDEPPMELMCPISHVYMTDEPVVAADGYTYERAAIEEWFVKQRAQIEVSKKQIAAGFYSERAKAIIENGIMSPMTNMRLAHEMLTPNKAVMVLARDTLKNGSR